MRFLNEIAIFGFFFGGVHLDLPSLFRKRSFPLVMAFYRRLNWVLVPWHVKVHLRVLFGLDFHIEFRFIDDLIDAQVFNVIIRLVKRREDLCPFTNVILPILLM
jgi:hypothetical protein